MRGEDLLYFADHSNDAVYILSYPLGKRFGQLSGLIGDPEAICSDKAGNVFVGQFNLGGSIISEFAHGQSTPFATLTSPGEPTACSTDTKNGTLAVAIYGYDPSQTPSGIALYANETGTAKFIADPAVAITACGYDPRGNLFIAGSVFSGQDHLWLGEIRSGTSTITSLNVPSSLDTSMSPNVIDWDGHHMTIGRITGGYYTNTYTIYQLSLSGTQISVSGTSELTLPHDDFDGDTTQYFYHRRVLLSSLRGSVVVFSYPNGERPITRSRAIAGRYNGGVTISDGP